MQVPAARIVFSEADRAEIAAATAEILATGQLTLGPYTREFENAFARAHAAPFAIAVNSGTAALEIILRAVDVAGADVVLPTNTFAATAFAVQRAGGRPVFADVDPNTFALSAETVAEVLTERTKAVVVVHVGGLIPAGVSALRALCDKRGLALVEDAAHAHGSQRAGRYAGQFGVAAAFSFYPTKVITSGEGGMIVTSDDRIRDEALLYRDQGKAGFLGNVHIRQGYAWRMSEIHAVTGLVHLRRLPEFLAVRARIAARYDAAIDANPGLERPRTPPADVNNYYKYIVLPSSGVDRTSLRKELKEKHGVGLAGEVYEAPLHQQPVFESLAAGTLPVAEDVCARHICLPIHSDMTDAEADHVLTGLSGALRAQLLTG
ncbi:DegT/DnrJ/EryC1/StrS family aminotransferase [Pseudofrankia inefficax]|uniref:DegT/DnrJ/EryC1/StrS aminotransferase n=1 Tax=Pseudofrankia inefficax (strain DSM 45817 / CECT 9037 / DDB 130130 / EuI1c) TaxID=298654 RepID=E3IUQ8_PSEI1|nr:DegT/DnrJ/EryC1/StrS family aminotransferase [Pseudofrankia inefficax]ADP84874.1 DegT/DnrJ/EryC1/StrS aminotransferase [Pseudofrankia inefficax]